jgi:LemA protein
MSTSTLLILLLAIVPLVLTVLFVSGYNKLVKLRERYKNSFSQIDVQLQRRYDLIPNLVETARGYLTHERETLEAVMTARKQAMAAERQAHQRPGDPAMMDLLQRAEEMLSTSLGRLYAVVENYPDLKADATMARVMEELTSTENRVAFARQAFNDDVMQYNTARQAVPAVVVAQLFGFGPAQPFHIDQADAREPVRVSFD